MRTIMAGFFGVLFFSQLSALPAAAQYASSVSQFGITWTFDRSYQTGRFANGDYWVVGPIVLSGVSPASTSPGGRWINGTMANPLPQNGSRQGYDSAMCGSYSCEYDSSLNIAANLPQTITSGTSVVSTVSEAEAGARPQIKTAAVLTVVTQAPAPGSFRPPYAGTDKTIRYNTSQLQRTILPGLAPVDNTPSIDSVAAYFERPWIDHISGWIGRYHHPSDNMPDYGSSIGNNINAGALSLCLNYTEAQKEQLLIRYVQLGIDLYGVWQSGGTWPANGGHSVGRKLPITFAAVLLDDSDMKSALQTSANSVFDENGGTYFSSHDGRALYGQAAACTGEEGYWRNLAFDTGSRTCPDPYKYIDGGHRPGSSYQFCCLSQPWKGEALAVLLIPEARQLWMNHSFFQYVDRWVASGAHSQPDPCAHLPAGLTEANWDSHYGASFGPDGSGSCIPDTSSADGTGRFPELHGASADGGHYGSAFVNSMWEAYRSTVRDPGAIYPNNPGNLRITGVS